MPKNEKLENNYASPEVHAQLKEMWRAFGMESSIGKKMFNMYNRDSRLKAVVNYPPVKTRSKTSAKKETVPKPCPQMTKIEYPSLVKPTPNPQPAILRVHKRRNQVAIAENLAASAENETPFVPAPGKNRAKMIADLQTAFRKKGIEGIELSSEEKAKINDSLKRRIGKLGLNFSAEPDENRPANKTESPEQELNRMFDDIMSEVQRDQALLARYEAEMNKDLINRTKALLVEKISDMQRIIALLAKVRSK